MNLTEEKLYKDCLNNILSRLENKIQFNHSSIDYDNVELIVESSSLDGIEKEDFSISFQKQNGSFCVITNNNHSSEKLQRISSLITEVSGITPLATYSFTDMPDIIINHWCYDTNKEGLNNRILNDLDRTGQIINLKYLHEEKRDIKK